MAVDRLVWVALRRWAVARRHSGFRASRGTYACRNSKFGEYCRLHGRAYVLRSTIGMASYVSDAHVVDANVGRFCSIGHGAMVGGLHPHPVGGLSTHPAFYSQKGQSGLSLSINDGFVERRPVNVGSDVWIASRALVLGGVSVGHGAIIAAGAIVTKDVQPYSVVAGVPAREIKMRFSAEVIDELLDWKWWDSTESELRAVASKFLRGDVWTRESVRRVRADADSGVGNDASLNGLKQH